MANILEERKYHSVRGLESNTRLQASSKEMNRALAYHAVLSEQQRRNSADFDAEEIARVYYSTSHSCQLWAQVVGLADERAAQEIQDECEEILFPKDEQTVEERVNIQKPKARSRTSDTWMQQKNSELARAA